jgi:hypothetical protein
MLLALELIVGRGNIWLPACLKRIEPAGAFGRRFTSALLRRIRWFERFSRPRLAPLLRQRLSGVLFGVVVFALALTTFLAPPFSGLDTLPSLGVVVLALVCCSRTSWWQRWAWSSGPSARRWSWRSAAWWSAGCGTSSRRRTAAKHLGQPAVGTDARPAPGREARSDEQNQRPAGRDAEERRPERRLLPTLGLRVMSPVLVAYGSKHGATAEIAERIRAVLASRG